jgi:hypothetical protein
LQVDETRDGKVKLTQKVVVKKNELDVIRFGVQADPKINFSFVEKQIEDA